MAQIKRVRFKLTGDKKPINWQLPINTTMLIKTLENGQKVRKKVHYIPGVESPFVEDYKGDEKPVKIWIQDGVLDVREDDPALLHICRAHPLNGVDFIEENREKDAEDELEGYELIQKALIKVDISQEDEAQAVALVVIGPEMMLKTAKQIKAALKKQAMTNAKTLLEELNKPDYHARFVAALAVMREVVLINPSQTAVTWPDGKTIINIAAGESATEQFGKFLAKNDPISKTTLQRIGELSKRGYNKKVIADLSEEVEEELNRDNVSLNDDFEPVPTIEEVRQMFSEVIGSDVPVNKKNDIDWMNSKIEENQVEA